MGTNHTTLLALLAEATARLAAHSESPALDAELLLSHVVRQPRSRLKSHPEEIASEAASSQFRELIDRRIDGEPLAYIVGYRHFWTLQLTVTPAVLVPRPETELLVERALSLRPEPHGNIVDLGTGSGAIALALASERPQWQVTATDVSEDALAVARANAKSLALERVEFLHGSWFGPLAGRRFNLIVSNPPYIGAAEPEMQSPALRHEPRGALSPGAAALESLAAIAQSAPLYLEPGGWLLLEHGSNQGPDVARELVGRGFGHVRSHRDLAGHERMTEGQWPARQTP
jgi:release factor glutamine methyltransferase